MFIFEVCLRVPYVKGAVYDDVYTLRVCVFTCTSNINMRMYIHMCRVLYVMMYLYTHVKIHTHVYI